MSSVPTMLVSGAEGSSLHARSGGVAGRVSADHTWCFTVPEQDLAETIASSLGGLSRAQADVDSAAYRVVTDRTALSILPDAPEPFSVRLVRRGARGSDHVCDGHRFLQPSIRAALPCGCGPTWTARRAAAKAGVGPKPDIRIEFRLSDAPSVGRFAFTSSSWDLAQTVAPMVEVALRQPGNRFECQLKVEPVRLLLPDGREVTYRSITVVPGCSDGRRIKQVAERAGRRRPGSAGVEGTAAERLREPAPDTAARGPARRRCIHVGTADVLQGPACLGDQLHAQALP
ncbi:recombination directionality factor [Kitasatospora sp. NPDC004240]